MHEWLVLKKEHLSGPEEMVPLFGKGNKDAIKWPHQAISSYKQKTQRLTGSDFIFSTTVKKHKFSLYIGHLKQTIV